MSWKKWDEDTWINISNGHTLEIDVNALGVEVYYYAPEKEQCVVFQQFTSKAEAAAFVEELIKG